MMLNKYKQNMNGTEISFFKALDIREAAWYILSTSDKEYTLESQDKEELFKGPLATLINYVVIRSPFLTS